MKIPKIPILAAAALICVLTFGCIAPPVPAPTKNIGYRGETRKVDLKFLRIGKPTREDVQARLGWSDVGLNRPLVFWGRWRSSSTLLPDNSPGDRRILWRAHNLLVEFDESNRVKRFQEFADNDLVAAVNGWLSTTLPNPAEKMPPQEVVVRLRQKDRAGETRLVLGEESIAFEGALTVPLPDIDRVTCTGSGSSPSEVRLTMRFKQPSISEKELIFDMEVPDVVSLLEFLRMKRSGGLR